MRLALLLLFHPEVAWVIPDTNKQLVRYCWEWRSLLLIKHNGTKG